jgi:hypothetical protein
LRTKFIAIEAEWFRDTEGEPFTKNFERSFGVRSKNLAALTLQEVNFSCLFVLKSCVLLPDRKAAACFLLEREAWR